MAEYEYIRLPCSSGSYDNIRPLPPAIRNPFVRSPLHNPPEEVLREEGLHSLPVPD